MVVAVLIVGVMEMALDEEVDVVAVRHRFVPAVLTVGMRSIVSAALVTLGAAVGVLLVHLEDVLIDVIAVRMM